MYCIVWCCRDIRAFYKKASYLVHSCIPNSVVVCDQNSKLSVQSYREIKKGEPITICYDNRALFWPIWKRRNYLISDYAFSCKCKRCTTSTDLDTYFFALPCASDACMENYKSGTPSFFVPEDPQVNTSHWVCKGCDKTCNFRRVAFLMTKCEESLNEHGVCAATLWAKMNELINQKYLHWNHFLVFQSCIKIFSMLWTQLNTFDTSVLLWYSKDNGIKFLPAANTLLHLTRTFMPFGYQNEHCKLLLMVFTRYCPHLNDLICM